MQLPRPVISAVLLVVAMVVVPLAGVAFANAVRPVIPQAPGESPGTATDVLPMPDPPATLQPLATWFERLPLVESGSHEAPRPFLVRYQDVPVGDPAAAAG